MKQQFVAFILTTAMASFAMSASAQVPEGDDIPPPPAEMPSIEDLPEEFGEGESRGTGPSISPEGAPANKDLIKKPDYSHLTPEAERTARLNKLFERLEDTLDPETANLIAEEIWAIWLDSGSASVNLLMRRGTAAQKNGELELARRMYDQVTLLEPDYAEGWSRSGRLALEDNDLNRALLEVTQALIYEPRHFYGLWTMGNIFERLGRTDEAFEAYSEAHKLYPGLKAVEDQMNRLRKGVEGDVL